MKIFNTLTRQKEEFVPLEEGKVKMYVCGPTVYNLIHIGNARPMIIFDTVRRYLEYKGYEVNYVSNFTDVDDKIIKKANEEGVTAEEISKRYIEECKVGYKIHIVSFIFKISSDRIKHDHRSCISDMDEVVNSRSADIHLYFSFFQWNELFLCF